MTLPGKTSALKLVGTVRVAITKRATFCVLITEILWCRPEPDPFLVILMPSSSLNCTRRTIHQEDCDDVVIKHIVGHRNLICIADEAVVEDVSTRHVWNPAPFLSYPWTCPPYGVRTLVQKELRRPVCVNLKRETSWTWIVL